MYGLQDGTYQKIVNRLAEFPKVERVKIYGSRAKGNYRNGSDIDLALWGPLTFSDIAHIRSELEELPTLYKFDVLHYETLDHADLKDHIDRVGKDLYVRGQTQGETK